METSLPNVTPYFLVRGHQGKLSVCTPTCSVLEQPWCSK